MISLCTGKNYLRGAVVQELIGERRERSHMGIGCSRGRIEAEASEWIVLGDDIESVIHGKPGAFGNMGSQRGAVVSWRRVSRTFSPSLPSRLCSHQL